MSKSQDRSQTGNEEQEQQTKSTASSSNNDASYDSLLGTRWSKVKGKSFLRQDEESAESIPSRLEELYLNDGVRRIDYVLAYTDEDPRKVQKRQKFEESLIEEGLELEHEDKVESKSKKTYFVKIHAPWEVCTRYAELMKMKMPIKAYSSDGTVAQRRLTIVLTEEEEAEEHQRVHSSPVPRLLRKVTQPKHYLEKLTRFLVLDNTYLPEFPRYFTCLFQRDRARQFLIKNQESFFSPSQRSLFVHEILSRAHYGDPDASEGIKEYIKSRMRFGIVRLMREKVYTAAFPLHEGGYDAGSIGLTEGDNERKLLYELWVKPKNWYKRQPLDLIRKYYGEKIAIYFAWLGFYTIMLVPAAVVGVICFLYGLFTLFYNTPSNEICDADGLGLTIMCPVCDLSCPYWHLKSSCLYSRLTHMFDNPATVFFSIFMALWATMFLEFWKRKQFLIAWDWDVMDVQDEGGAMRPQYEARATKMQRNPVNEMMEPVMERLTAYKRKMASISTIMFMLFLVLSAVFGVIVYRVSMVSVMYASNVDLIRQNALLSTTFTAATINCISIFLMSIVYRRIAVALTDIECPRTQQDYEDSFTFKMFLFQCVNFYSTLVYVGFVKGKFFINPSGKDDVRLFGYRMDQCDPAGCLISLCIQLAMIMIGKQVGNNCKELGLPLVLNFLRKLKMRKKVKISQTDKSEANSRWEMDYLLEMHKELGLFDEYLEMVIQYGFVTLFVAAFPLAPLCALFNNVIEIRLDAYKYVTQFRRPLATPAHNVGAWYGILKAISILAVITNAFVISHTSDFIPRLVYLYKYSPDNTLTGYVNNSLSYFAVTDFEPGTAPGKELEANKQFENVTICRYRGYDYPPSSPNAYEHTAQYWHVFAARVLFIVIFEHLVFFLTGCIAIFIPDTPQKVKDQILREKYLAKEALYKAELERTKEMRRLESILVQNPSATSQVLQQYGNILHVPDSTMNIPVPGDSTFQIPVPGSTGNVLQVPRPRSTS